MKRVKDRLPLAGLFLFLTAASLAVPWLGALAQPGFNGLFQSVVADAGSIGSLQVVAGIQADGGAQFGPASVGYGPFGGTYAGLWFTPTPTTSNFAIISNGTSMTQVNAPSAGMLYLGVGNSATVTITSNATAFGSESVSASGNTNTGYLENLGQVIGDGGAFAALQVAAGTVVSNIGVGACALASGQCNAVVAGANGASVCACDVEGNWASDAGAFTCHVRADAGSATAFLFTATGTALPGTPTVGVHCFN